MKLWIGFENVFLEKAVAKFVHSVEPDFKKAAFHLRSGLFVFIYVKVFAACANFSAVYVF